MKPQTKLWTIYVLKLVEGKYYVGRSNILNINHRIKQHCFGKGAKWTQLYKPIAIQELIDFCPGYVETSKTIEYMRKYGWENVRGGGYIYTILKKPKCLNPNFASQSEIAIETTMVDYWNRIKAEKSLTN